LCASEPFVSPLNTYEKRDSSSPWSPV